VPHWPATPAPRYANLFTDLKAPRTTSYDEADVSDKPQYIQRRGLLTQKQRQKINGYYIKRLQTLQSVDEMVSDIVKALEDTGQLDDTYIIFTSDNGYHLGQHRPADGKQTPYEEDIRVPLIV
jgi:arylsulfatase A-like enzyme